MSVIETLITDRSQADVSRAAYLRAGYNAGTLTVAEKAEWDGSDLRGAYNASDLNRVGEACAYLYGELARFGYTVPGYVPLKTDWYTETDETPPNPENYPAQEKMQTYLSTVAALKAVFDTAIALPDTMSRLTVEGANNIERVFVEIDATLRQMVYAFHRTDEFGLHSGEAFIPTANDDMGRTWGELDAMETTWGNWDAATWYLLLYGNMKAEA